jgi:hypothetical protein
LLGDFQAIYGLNLQDVFTGIISVRRARLLAEQLLTHHASRYRAAVSGDQAAEWMWGPTQSVLADLYDLVTVLTSALGGQKPTADDMYPRPHIAAPAAAAVPTIAEFNVDAFLRQINS